MNERIKELAEQAELNLELQSLAVEKFARLIAQECIVLCQKEHAHSIHSAAGPWNTAIKRCKVSIAKQFEISE
jgi:hypothetical protein